MKFLFEPTYYETLGVSENATLEEIKKAYREGALKTHPDIKLDGTAKSEAFVMLTQAYETLGDETKRLTYDQALSDYRLKKEQERMAAQQTEQRKRAIKDDHVVTWKEVLNGVTAVLVVLLVVVVVAHFTSRKVHARNSR